MSIYYSYYVTLQLDFSWHHCCCNVHFQVMIDTLFLIGTPQHTSFTWLTILKLGRSVLVIDSAVCHQKIHCIFVAVNKICRLWNHYICANLLTYRSQFRLLNTLSYIVSKLCAVVTIDSVQKLVFLKHWSKSVASWMWTCCEMFIHVHFSMWLKVNMPIEMWILNVTVHCLILLSRVNIMNMIIADSHTWKWSYTLLVVSCLMHWRPDQAVCSIVIIVFLSE